MPLDLDQILREGNFSASEIEKVRHGELVQGGSLDAASDKELSVRLAFHVKGQLDNVAQLFLNFPKKKEFDPTVQELGMIAEDGGQGSLSDFSTLTLQPNPSTMDKLYHNAAPGSDLNLSKSEIDLFHKLGKKATHAQIEDTLRQILLRRFQSYKSKGLNGIEPYARSKKAFSPGDELKRQVEASLILKKRAPIFHKYCMEYPENKPEGAEESFFWVNSVIDDKPTVALVHRVGMKMEGGYVYMERHFYLSRSHNCLQGIGAALSVGGEDGSEPGSVVMYATRTSTDQVSGFGSAAKRTIGNKVMGGRMAENFERARHIVATAKELDMMKIT